MIKDVIISNKKILEEKKKKLSEDGFGKFHILTDFDNTLTKKFVDGQKSHTVIAQLRNFNYLTSDYSEKAHKLFDKYNPIEINPKISLSEKKKKMHEWWMEHFKLLMKSKLNKKDIERVVKERDLSFRDGAMEFLEISYKSDIPLIIMSASGLGDAIPLYLKKENRLYNNIHIVSNFFEYDFNGNFIRIKEPIIHSMNKDETAIQKFPVFDIIKNRKNVLLLGDSIADTGMVKGFDYKTLIKVGFLNEKVKENLNEFKKNFDIVITNDGSMKYINNLLKKII